MGDQLLKSNLALRIFSALFLSGIAIASLFYGSPLFEALLVAIFFLLILELKNMPFKGKGPLLIVFYLVISFSSIYWLFTWSGEGKKLILWLFCIVWFSDIGGYCAGKFFGGPKVLPKVSPNKTWAGVVGACFLTIFSLAFLEFYYDIPFDMRDYDEIERIETSFFLISLIFSLLSQIGDFLASYIKRRLNIKDTGSLIPGHGGFFDRLDGLIFVSPIFALFTNSSLFQL